MDKGNSSFHEIEESGSRCIGYTSYGTACRTSTKLILKSNQSRYRCYISLVVYLPPT